MNERLLEIGAGASPAIQNPGWLFAEEKIEYYAVDAEGVSNIVTWNSTIFGDAKHETYQTACMGVIDKLPFRNESFGRVIMKSVIGEYSLDQLKGRSSNEVSMSGQTFLNTLNGLEDVLRVLEPGGELIISEEDTPANCLQLATQLSDVGFKNINITPYCTDYFRIGFNRYDSYSLGFITDRDPQFMHASKNWKELRGAYWALANRCDKYSRVLATGFVSYVAERYYRNAYLMTAHKPSNE